MERVFYQVGDTVILKIKNQNSNIQEERAVTISGFVKQHSNLSCGYNNGKWDEETGITYWNPSFYLPMAAYTKLYPEQSIMSFLFDVKVGQEEEMEKFLVQYL